MEADRHPQERQLEMIRSWPDSDHLGLMEYVESLWQIGEWGWKQQRNPFTGQVAFRTYQVSTGGRSGNEDIIAALEANRPFWEQSWVSYRLGGHYEFKVKMVAANLQVAAGKALPGETEEKRS
jgi:hypothetical protein